MPAAPEHPVTLEDLWVQYVPDPPLDDMPDLRPATVADLVSALRAEGELILDDLGDCYRYTTPYRFHSSGLTMQEAFEAEGGKL